MADEWNVVAHKKRVLDGKPIQAPYDHFFWEVALTYNDTVVGIWGGPNQSSPMILTAFSFDSLKGQICQTLQLMLRMYDMELWRKSPSEFELDNMIAAACEELLGTFK